MVFRIMTIAILVGVATTSPVSGEDLDIDPGADHLITLWPELDGASRYSIQEDQGDGVIRLSNVENPTLAVYLAPHTGASTPAVLVCPGGGYAKLAYNKEGTEVAEWLNSLGISAAVLKYRVPGNRAGALADAQRAMGLLRHHGEEWHIDPERIGILGFSAGGHLAACASNNFAERSYVAVDDADALSSRPNFSVLVYPAYLGGADLALVPEAPVSGNTPPAFIVQTQDDKHYIDSSISYYVALKNAGVSGELHVYPKGGHGYGLRPSENAVSTWPTLCGRWLKTIGVLSKD